MATVAHFLPSPADYYDLLQARSDKADVDRRRRYLAIITIQRYIRGYLIRKWIAWLSYNAIIIQCAFRVRRARKIYRQALKRAVRRKITKYYNWKAAIIQALWRGFISRKAKFCYYSYRLWLAAVKERNERCLAEVAEFRIRCRADDLKILEEEARHWLAYVIFKLHHLLRTESCAGVYSIPATTELSEFEKLLTSIRYTDYMKRLRKKYNEFVKKNKPKFSNKRLFPVIGEGKEFWYLSLADMYKMTSTERPAISTRHDPMFHGPQHKKPFRWRSYRPCGKSSPTDRDPVGDHELKSMRVPAPPPGFPKVGEASPATPSSDLPQKDPRFHLYVKHYTPQPDIFDYVDFHINAVLSRKYSIENMDKE